MYRNSLLLSLIILASGSIYAASDKAEIKAVKRGDPQAGSELVATCAGCHGADGNSVVGQWPTLAGQRESYTLAQLIHVQKGERMIESMMGLLDNYSEDQLRDIAAFYAAQEVKVGQADSVNFELGQRIYRAGNLSNGVPACTGCHGPQGKGVESAGYPMLSGQKAEYVVTSLVAYKNGERVHSSNAKIMQGIAARLTTEEIRAVANYVSGLY
ncbi:cytochrome c4 [SAR86 cluster bacterium]|nr:cytochrome c4 [SAR86 cluster bacterium]